MRSNYRIDSVLCLVDAKNIITQLARKPVDEGTATGSCSKIHTGHIYRHFYLSRRGTIVKDRTASVVWIPCSSFEAVVDWQGSAHVIETICFVSVSTLGENMQIFDSNASYSQFNIQARRRPWSHGGPRTLASGWWLS